MNADGVAKFTGEVRLNEQWLDQPLRWRRPRMIFVCAHGDLFHENVPDEWIDRVFAVMALSPQHTFQVLTKRPGRARGYLRFHQDKVMDLVANRVCDEEMPVLLSVPPEMVPPPRLADSGKPVIDLRRWPLPNVWLGTSVEDQPTAAARIPHLLATPAAVRFVSAEPLLGPVDLTEIWVRMSGGGESLWNALDKREAHDAALEGDVSGNLDWVIVGGESGPKARPMHPDWARSLRDQCQAAGVAKNVVISSNIPTRRDGTPYRDGLTELLENPGLAVYFTRGKRLVCLPCDTYRRPWENARAIGKAVEAMRSMERHGAQQILDQAFEGFTALPAPEGAPSAGAKEWFEILGVAPTASAAEIHSAYKDLCRALCGATVELNAAKETGLARC